jgi:hypothetical protein
MDQVAETLNKVGHKPRSGAKWYGTGQVVAAVIWRSLSAYKGRWPKSRPFQERAATSLWGISKPRRAITRAGLSFVPTHAANLQGTTGPEIRSGFASEALAPVASDHRVCSRVLNQQGAWRSNRTASGLRFYLSCPSWSFLNDHGPCKQLL